MPNQPLTVHGADLVQADGGGNVQTIARGRMDHDFNRVRYWRNGRRNGGDDRHRAIAVTNVVLDDKGRSGLLDLVAYRRVKRTQDDVTALDVYFLALSCLWTPDFCHASSS